MIRHFAVLALAILTTNLAAADTSNLPATIQAVPQGVVGADCSTEGEIGQALSTRSTDPITIVCADHHWRDLSNQGASTGSRLAYTGQCSYRYNEGDALQSTLVVRANSLADVCLPAGWTVKEVATSNGLDWQMQPSHQLSNVFFVRPIASLSLTDKTTVYVYPLDSQGKVAERLELDLRVAQ